MPNLKRVQPACVNADECALHILYIDRLGATQKMVVAMSQSQSEVINKADEIKAQFSGMLTSFGCTPLSIQLELIESADPSAAPRNDPGTPAHVIPLPSRLNGFTGVGFVCDWFVELPCLSCFARYLERLFG